MYTQIKVPIAEHGGGETLDQRGLKLRPAEER